MIGDWRDPGDDLPPMRLTIPRRRVHPRCPTDVEDPDDYYTFLEQPPVEQVQRLYSIDEVKRSARVRDIARRVDLDTLNFEFGSASISDTEVQQARGRRQRHGEAVEEEPGRDLPDRRPHRRRRLAEWPIWRCRTAAPKRWREALTNVFGIPPENLTTQGYGEQYLKVNTAAPDRENRRVAIRRITPLVAPVASNN